ncbi:hypothetical protein F4775DRAFT_542851 [Biscogniauxia sp. FL1348]|nr:hypothetical protein F4775DRAFT_542851 [Biscogniauxia sp. FL1348]
MMRDNPYALLDAESAIAILHVGERDFKTTRQTLVNGSGHFARRIEETWDHNSNFHSYFIDRDPDLFLHILEFLRSGRHPVFFDFNTHVFDLVKYHALLLEARFFEIPKLEGWIAGKKYLRSIKLERSITVVPDLNQASPVALHIPGINDPNMKISINWITKKVPVCPRGIFVHRGDPNKCGQACHRMRAQQDEGMMFEDEAVPTGVIIRTNIEIDPSVIWER